MTPRDRLLAHLRGRPADRIGATLYEFSHLDGRRPLDDPGYAALAEMQRAKGEVFHSVALDAGTGAGDPNIVTEGEADPGASQQRMVTLDTPLGPLRSVSRRDAGNLTWWRIEPLLKTAEDCRRWLSLPEPTGRPDPAAARAARQRVGKAGVVLFGPGDPLGIVCGMFSYDDFAMILLEDEGVILEMLRRVHERLCKGLRVLCAGVTDLCVRFWGPEYAGAPLLNPHVYFPKLVTDFLREPIAIVNGSGNFSVMHIHGRLAELLDYVEELGPTALEPLEIGPATTANVSAERLAERLDRKSVV